MAGTLRARLARGDVAICMAVRLVRSVEIVTIARTVGYDALYVDLEHGQTDLAATAQICAAALAADLSPLVRVPSHSAADIGRALDAGAAGIIVPHVENAAEAEAVVRRAKYPPRGQRSFGGLALQLGYAALPQAEAMQRLDEQGLVIAMIETGAAVEAAAEIAAVDGIDMLLVGSGDLGADLGLPGRQDHPRMRAAIATVAEACRRHGRLLGLGGIKSDVRLIADYVALGARFISAGNDLGHLLAAARTQVNELRAIVPPGTGQDEQPSGG